VVAPVDQLGDECYCGPLVEESRSLRIAVSALDRAVEELPRLAAAGVVVADDPVVVREVAVKEEDVADRILGPPASRSPDLRSALQ